MQGSIQGYNTRYASKQKLYKPKERTNIYIHQIDREIYISTSQPSFSKGNASKCDNNHYVIIRKQRTKKFWKVTTLHSSGEKFAVEST